jgi:hypothetical protein
MSDLPTLLAELEQLWRERDVISVDRLAPGLEPSEIRMELAARDLPAPQEVVDWFAWHNGTIHDGLGPEIADPGGFALISLDLSLRARDDRLEAAAQLAEETGGAPEVATVEAWWQQNWLPLTGEHPLTAELTNTSDGAVPIRVVFWDDLHNSRAVRSSSLAEVVSLWLWALREHWRVDEVTGRGRVAYDELPVELGRTGLF